jgi:hypothetical protein
MSYTLTASSQDGALIGGPVTFTSGTASVKENTQLERHLYALRAIHEELGGAATRAMTLADRLLGQEPANIAKPGMPKDSMEPPLMVRLEGAITQTDELVKAVHYHLNRLERL